MSPYSVFDCLTQILAALGLGTLRAGITGATK
jgi:hypothetical protein